MGSGGRLLLLLAGRSMAVKVTLPLRRLSQEETGGPLACPRGAAGRGGRRTAGGGSRCRGSPAGGQAKLPAGAVMAGRPRGRGSAALPALPPPPEAKRRGCGGAGRGPCGRGGAAGAGGGARRARAGGRYPARAGGNGWARRAGTAGVAWGRGAAPLPGSPSLTAVTGTGALQSPAARAKGSCLGFALPGR